MFREGRPINQGKPEEQDKPETVELAETEKQGFLERNKIWLSKALALEGIDQKKRAGLMVALGGTWGAIRAMEKGQGVEGALGYIGVYAILALASHKFWENPRIKAWAKRHKGEYIFEDEDDRE